MRLPLALPVPAWAPDRLRATAAQIGFFASSGVLMPFLPVWLAARGLDRAGIAAVLAASVLARALLLVGFGWAANRLVPAGLLLAGSALAAAAALLAGAGAPGAGAAAALTVLGLGLFNASSPLVDAFTNLAAARTGVSFGRIRVWGSIAYLAANLAAGAALAWRVPAVLAPLAAAAFCLMLALAAAPGALARREAEPLPGGGTWDWRLVLLLAPAVLINASHAAYYAFGTLRWLEHGIGLGLAGPLWAAGVLAEIVAFPWFGRIADRHHPALLLGASGLLAAARWLLMATDPSFPLLLIGQVGHAASFALPYLATMAVIRRRVPAEAQPRVQSVYGLANAIIAGGGATALIPRIAALGMDPYFAMALLALAATALAALAWALPRARPTPPRPNPTLA